MNIITHNPRFVQAGIPPNTYDTQTNYHNYQFLNSKRDTVQEEAYYLYDLGFNVFPQPLGKKGGYNWKRLQYNRLSRDDRSYGLQNVFAGQSNIAIMCGATSGNLFVIDCETPQALRHHMTEMRKRGLPLWVAQTARGGHIYLRASNGEVHNIEPGVLKGAEVKGQNGYVLAPPSVHPSGAIYNWVIREGDEPPVIHTSNINWLKDRNNNLIQLITETTTKTTRGNWSYRIVSPCSNLSKATTDYISNGHSIQEGNRNNRLFNAACDMYGNNYTYHDALSILEPIAIASGLPRLEIHNTISSAFSKQRTPARPETQPIHTNLSWHHALVWLTQYEWYTRTSITDRVVILALIERCRLSANDNHIFRASVREIATLGRLGTKTVQKSLQRLIANEIIQRSGNDYKSGATLYRFTDIVINEGKAIELKSNTVIVPPHWLRYSVALFNSDASERGALGHSVMFVYQYMMTMEKPMMPSAIADAMGLSVNQVNYALKKLQGYELVQRVEAGWFPVKMELPELDAHVDEKADCVGKGARRIARFREERGRFAGRILFDARIRYEGKRYIRSVQMEVEKRHLMDDPLIALGLELGGIIQHRDGRIISGRMLPQ